MSKTKALVLLSGGLDSMLAARLLLEQGIKVVGITFESNFFNAKRARRAAKQLGVDLKVVDIKDEELELVKNPPSGYGKHLNPCIDCHSLMIKRTGAIARKEGFNIVATGEVLGQRPFSQNKEALNKVRELSLVDVLRPLSAKLLPITMAEEQGLVIRGKLLSIRGRSREKQMALAQKLGLNEYPSPAGGCLLTDPGFSERLGKMLDYWPDCYTEDVELLKHGRVLWLTLEKDKKSFKILLIIGRHKEDNESLILLKRKNDVMIELKDMMGPTTIIRFKNVDLRFKNEMLEIIVPEKLKMGELKLGDKKNVKEIMQIACLLTGFYATKARGKEAKCKIMV